MTGLRSRSGRSGDQSQPALPGALHVPARTTVCRLALDPADRARHFAIRRAVFVDEQRMFDGDDSDDRDLEPATLLALGFAGPEAGGAVRLYRLDDGGRWKGDRLAVLPNYRGTSLGASLVRFAVRTAGVRGGAVMVAMIQLPNVRFFETLGWRPDGAVVEFHGRAHQPMAIGLARPDR
jgi:putative N-acetyltransferase (TIGR04045 family)